MKVIKKISFISLIVIFCFSFILLSSCKAEPQVITKTVVETITETVVETVIESAPEGASFDDYMEMARNREYIDEPAKLFEVAFANISAEQPFCKDVEDSIISEWALAGGSRDNLLVLDNKRDTTTAIQNADMVLAQNPDLFIQFMNDTVVNEMTSMKYAEAGIPIIAIDIPVPKSVFVGQDNWGLSVRMGQWIIDQLDTVYGGWENVDIVFINTVPRAGTVTYLRYRGFVELLIETFGEEADPESENSKVVVVDSGGTTDSAQPAFQDALSAYPDAENIIAFNNNDQVAAGTIAAAETLGRYDKDKWILVTLGCDSQGRQFIREGKADAGMGFFPDRYGETIIPVALSIMNNVVTPPDIRVISEILTRDNVDEFYPED